jgi:hypothetical protein
MDIQILLMIIDREGSRPCLHILEPYGNTLKVSMLLGVISKLKKVFRRFAELS